MQNMQLDQTSLMVGAVGIVCFILVVGISAVFVYYIFRARHEAKKKYTAKTHRKDLSAVITSLNELVYAHLGYLFLSTSVMFMAMQMRLTVPDPRFFAVCCMFLAVWYLAVPLRGTLKIRDMVREMTTPSDKDEGATPSAIVTPLDQHRRAG